MRLRSATAQRRILAFHRRLGDAHLILARHAAFPLALTPDLLYRIWANFQRDSRGRLRSIPWVAVADLLLSNLCENVGPELFEMNDQIRSTLLSQLRDDADFGAQRIDELAEFLLDYIRGPLRSDDPDIRDFARAQQVTALAYTRPDRAATELAKALAATHPVADAPEMLRMVALVEANAEPLAGFAPLLTYARGMGRYVRGDLQGAASFFGELGRGRPRVRVEGVGLTIPARFVRSEAGSEDPATREFHLTALVRALHDGRCVIFLGPDVNVLTSNRVPASRFLSEQLAWQSHFPRPFATDGSWADLARVAEHAAVVSGPQMLREIAKVLADVSDPAPLHRRLASLISALHARGPVPRYPLVVTMSWDDALEQAFDAERVPYDVVSYSASGPHRGRFLHAVPGGPRIAIEQPNQYRALSLERCTIILKASGTVNRSSPADDSFAITEDDFIDYLADAGIASLLPIPLPEALRMGHLLLLGCRLRDWTQRTVLRRLWAEWPRTSLMSRPGDPAEADLERPYANRYHMVTLPLEPDAIVEDLLHRVREVPSSERAHA
jgi:hypothetical protein